jgi:hypothetical protein
MTPFPTSVSSVLFVTISYPEMPAGPVAPVAPMGPCLPSGPCGPWTLQFSDVSFELHLPVVASDDAQVATGLGVQPLGLTPRSRSRAQSMPAPHLRIATASACTLLPLSVLCRSWSATLSSLDADGGRLAALALFARLRAGHLRVLARTFTHVHDKRAGHA